MAILTVMQVNWGRGETPAEFRAAASAVWWHFTAVARQGDDGSGAKAVALTCEVDEADLPDEHGILRDIVGPNVGWAGPDTREPIITPASIDLVSSRVLAGAPGVRHYSPTRTITEAVVDWPGTPLIQPVPLLTGHRAILRKGHTEQARLMFTARFDARCSYWADRSRSYVYGLDPNGRWPTLVKGEKTAIQQGGLGIIRYREAKGGNRLDLLATGTVDQHIDGHHALWARFRVTPPAA